MDKYSPSNQFLLYQTEDGKTHIQCRFVEESLWLPQAQIAELFQVKTPTINEHLKNIYSEEELEPERTIRKFLIVQQEGNRQVKRNTDHYNLEAILAVGYRVRSKRGTQFRRWATGKTAAELIHERADHTQNNMGLTSFKGKTPLKQETTVAKNYLSEAEIAELNRIVVMWLDFAEDQASRRKQVFLQDWETKLDQFLEFNEREVLNNAGKVSKKQADEKARREYDQYRQDQRARLESQQETTYIDELRQIAQSQKSVK